MYNINIVNSSSYYETDFLPNLGEYTREDQTNLLTSDMKVSK